LGGTGRRTTGGEATMSRSDLQGKATSNGQMRHEHWSRLASTPKKR